MRPARRVASALLVLAAAVACACSDEGGDGVGAGEPDAASPVGPVPPEAQRPGDPARGYDTLVNAGYVTCGVPWSLYERFFGPAPTADRLPGRTGKNAELPYDRTAYVAPSGVEIVTTNCLACHAGRIDGQLVVGLGDAAGDWTTDASFAVKAACALVEDPAEKAECDEWARHSLAIAPYTVTKTVGVNPADNLAAVLFAHRDRDTLAWSDEPLLPLPPADLVVPVDVPPWWRMKKKHAMFYSAAGRGDHARIMMAASLLCTDSVDEARAIDAWFPDVRAYLAAIEPPPWPWPVDAALAARGREVFKATCSRCHGTYGEGGSYPNLVVALEDVGTDPYLAVGASQFAGLYVEWFNGSFFGEISRLAPARGYYAPPLDGIWATAPFLHNGSVPTLRALLDSGSRPRSWTRSFDSTDYDPDDVGWRFIALEHGQDDEPDPDVKRRIYDTTQLGYGNQGHTFGDALPAEDREALLEYLKTL